MLLERHRQLLTAYVDGELTNRQRRYVDRLLRRSAEARSLLAQLLEDARTLGRLPQPQLPADLSGPILRTIAERRLTPRSHRPGRVTRYPAWVAPAATWAAAAAVLLLLGVGSYLYFATSLVTPPHAPIAQTEADPVVPKHRVEPVPQVASRTDTPSAKPQPKSPHSPEKAPLTKAPEVDRTPEKPAVPATPPARPNEETAFTGRLELLPTLVQDLLLPAVFKIRDLDQESGRQKLLGDLRKDRAFRLELPCRHGSRALDRLQAVARAHQLGLLIEKRAQDYLKLPAQLKTSYAVYLENLTPEELTQLLRHLGGEDRKNTRKPADAEFESLVVTRLTSADHKELAELLGQDPTETEPEPAPKGPLGTDPRKSLADLTTTQVTQALAGQGATARPEAGKPSLKPVENVALVLAYTVSRPSVIAPEVKHFLDTRTPARPGTLRVLLVLRS
jgi:hypothetical protein